MILGPYILSIVFLSFLVISLVMLAVLVASTPKELGHLSPIWIGINTQAPARPLSS